ncbi:uncharacterized protein [Enoplosus armatus]|uniref:uncharacterized protein n=1 Tax=Enoplosus armatus TaxID=215367 RepID=UPI00399324C1
MDTSIFVFVFVFSSVLIQTAEVPRHISLTMVEVGGNVSLQCPVSEKDGKFFHWYKQSLGYMIQNVAAGTFDHQTFSAQFNNPRFNIEEGKDQYLLTIRNVTKEDEATYFCQNGTAYSQSFVYGIFLAVNGKIHRSQQRSFDVKQSPETASVPPGDSVTLQCSLLFRNKEKRVQCPGEHNVYWFRAGSGKSHPGFIYNHSSDEQEDSRSCVYSLPRTIQNSSDAGTYYCAVVTCGEILFGEGTKVETREFVNIAKDGDAEEINYAALNFSMRKVKRVKKERESPQECVYSPVRADYHTRHHPSL